MAKIQTKAFTNVKPIALPASATPGFVTIDVDFPTTALAANDLIELAEIPAGYQVLDYAVVFPDIDSGGAPALAFSLGVESEEGTDLGAEVWGTGITAGQSTAIVRAATSAAAQGNASVTRKVALKVTTAAAAYAGAGKKGQVLLLLQG